ncbi:MAG: arginine deiminase family protein [Luteibaculaceae bacterium]
MNVKVTSEIGKLRKVLVHSPDGGIGNVPTNKLHDWLYDDIVDVHKIQQEYVRFKLLLLLFLEPEKIFSKTGEFILKTADFNQGSGLSLVKPNELNPEKSSYLVNKENVESSAVLDTQYLLQYLFEKYPEKARTLITTICVHENVHHYRINDIFGLIEVGSNLLNGTKNGYVEAVKTLLTGKLEFQKKNLGDGKWIMTFLEGEDAKYIFPPIPNFIFTRDIGVSIGNHLLITKPKFNIRKREVILMRFIAENFFFNETNGKQIIDVAEDDNFFQLENSIQEDRVVTYEGGDIMMISKRHLIIGCSERTSPYAIQKLVNRLFWENVEMEKDSQLDIITVVKIQAKRSQMHIDTVMSQVREDIWVLHSPLSEVWQKRQKEKHFGEQSYLDVLSGKTQEEIEEERGVSLLQFYLNPEAKALKEQYKKSHTAEERRLLKEKFRKLDFLLVPDKENNNSYKNHTDCPYRELPNGLEDLLTKISVYEYGQKAENVKFILSGGGEQPFDEREQWTDACNLLILRSGVAVGYDRNHKTAKHFNELFLGQPICNYPGFSEFIKQANLKRFKNNRDNQNNEMDLVHIFHVDDLLYFIGEKKLSLSETKVLIDGIKNCLILLPSNELSRARGGSHCMSMPILRDNAI